MIDDQPCPHLSLTHGRVQGEPTGFVCRRCGTVLPLNHFCPDCVRAADRSVVVPCELHRDA